MASNCARNFVPRSTSSAKALLFRAKPSNSAALPSTVRLSPRCRSFFSSSFRLPVELGCGESLMPLHSVTALALLNRCCLPKLASGVIFLKALQHRYNGAFEVLNVKFHG